VSGAAGGAATRMAHALSAMVAPAPSATSHNAGLAAARDD